jgi:hypothetical protein
MKGWIKATMIAGITAGVLWIFAKNKIIPQNIPIVGDIINNFYVQFVLGIGAIVIFGSAFFFALVYVPAQEHDIQESNNKKLSDELERIKVTPFTFPLLAYHAEYKIKNAGAKRVADYIRQNLLSILGHVNTGTLLYETNLLAMQYYDPEKNNTLRHGIVMPGLIYDVKLGAGEILQLINGRGIDELFVVSVVAGSQGNNKTSLVNYDTNIKDVYAPISNLLRDELKKVFELEIIEDEKIKPWETFKNENLNI